MSTDTTTRPKEYRKLNDEMIEKLSGYVAAGNYFSVACYLCGINEATLYIWLQEAKRDKEGNGDSLPSKLFNALKTAEAQAEAERVARIAAAGVGGQVARRVTRTKRDGTEEVEETYQLPQWLADMTHLERRHPERWGRRDRLQVEENKRVEVSVIVKHYSEEIPAPPQASQVTEGEFKELGVGAEGGDDAAH